MSEVQKYIENRITELGVKIASMTCGINARRKLRSKIGSKIRDIKLSSKAVARDGRSTAVIDEIYRDFLIELEENEAIIENLRAYREESRKELAAFKRIEAL